MFFRWLMTTKKLNSISAGNLGEVTAFYRHFLRDTKAGEDARSREDSV